jgi:Flavodoxins
MRKINGVILVVLIAIILIPFIKIVLFKHVGDIDNKQDKTAISAEAADQKAVDQKASEEEGAKAEKVLIVYFSLTGNTSKAAGIMKNLAKCDVFEIKPDFDYSKVKSREEMEKLGKKQIEEGFKPELTNSVDNIDDYDLIIIGSPVWWFSVTPPVMSFLSQYDLKGKKVAPFCTCNSMEGDFFTQFEDAIPDADIQKGIILKDDELKNEKEVKEKIRTWLEDLGCKLG